MQPMNSSYGNFTEIHNSKRNKENFCTRSKILFCVHWRKQWRSGSTGLYCHLQELDTRYRHKKQPRCSPCWCPTLSRWKWGAFSPPFFTIYFNFLFFFKWLVDCSINCRIIDKLDIIDSYSLPRPATEYMQFPDTAGSVATIPSSKQPDPWADEAELPWCLDGISTFYYYMPFRHWNFCCSRKGKREFQLEFWGPNSWG